MKTQETIAGQARQGDVLFERVTQKPARLTLVEPENGHYVIARGEATGHHHSVPASAGLLEIDEGGVMYLTVEELTAVEHQEHAPIPREPGVYRIRRQQEQMFGHWQRVAD